ncbi:MAG: alpha-L-fucosidase [Phycisphaerae bacterium]|jgi:alpha-L-fucosidase|nr:alpha-L-fucosidase [Phycisphaerae bacterium]
MLHVERMKWFHKARFGMFIHWGLYSLLGRGEAVMFHERIPTADYARLAARFRPRKFDARRWAALAVEAGMKYMVLTTRHHDGFCLFDSKADDFNSVKTAARRDFVAEYVKACRGAGLKVGLYYSLLDLRCPGYWEPAKHKASKEALVRLVHEQVRELLTNYGRIDLLWYDGGWLADSTTPKAIGKFWKAKQLNTMARRLQPRIIINNRSGPREDYDTPEQHVSASPPGRAWESCMTIGDLWPYVPRNRNIKPVGKLLQNLISSAAGEGNLLLNVGPRPDGTICRDEAVRLQAMGQWLRTNGEAIYGSQRCGLTNVMLGPWTRKGKVGYLHLFHWPGTEAVVPFVKTRALSATLLETGQRVKVRQEHNGRLVIHGLPRRPPCPSVTVIKVRFRDVPRAMKISDKAAWLTGKAR